MVKKNVVPLPIKYTQLMRNKRGKFSVNCLLSNKWLRFGSTSTEFDVGEACLLDVMQENEDGTNERICQMVVTKEELLDVLGYIKPK